MACGPHGPGGQAQENPDRPAQEPGSLVGADAPRPMRALEAESSLLTSLPPQWGQVTTSSVEVIFRYSN